MAYQEISAVQYPITLVRNDDWNKEIPVNDSAGDPFLFTGWEAKAEVRKYSGSAVVITFDTTAATMTLTEGKITLIAAKANTDIENGNYVWDCEFTDADGKIRTLIRSSKFTIVEDITE